MSFDPKSSVGPGSQVGPVTVEIPGRTAMLMIELAKQLGAETPGQVVAQALGLLQTVQRAKEQGQRILLRDPKTGREIDLGV
ncbi:MAG: hypothetical protein H6712_16100 [Myxococcales bacterium]|nr:hypothetical protein [Myxococcales bacterium]MCB9715391.1 hypothetical protein [Myxococcales bacterium]